MMHVHMSIYIHYIYTRKPFDAKLETNQAYPSTRHVGPAQRLAMMPMNARIRAVARLNRWGELPWNWGWHMDHAQSAPVGMVKSLLWVGHSTYQRFRDFVHQQHHAQAWISNGPTRLSAWHELKQCQSACAKAFFAPRKAMRVETVRYPNPIVPLTDGKS